MLESKSLRGFGGELQSLLTSWNSCLVAMYFPIGWPKVLHGGHATRGHPVKVFRHRTKDMVIELRSHSVGFWHTRVSLKKLTFVLDSN